jgi:hypothetical protein
MQTRYNCGRKIMGKDNERELLSTRQMMTQQNLQKLATKKTLKELADSPVTE